MVSFTVLVQCVLPLLVRYLTILASLLVASAPASASSLQWAQLPPLPDPLGVAAPFAGVSGGALLVAGGANFQGW